MREEVLLQKSQQQTVYKEEQMAVLHSAIKEKKLQLSQRVDRTQSTKQQQNEEYNHKVRVYLEAQEEKFSENIQ